MKSRDVLALVCRYVSVCQVPGYETPGDWAEWASELSGMDYHDDVHVEDVEAAIASVPKPKRVEPSAEHQTFAALYSHMSECCACQDDPRGLCPEGKALARKAKVV